MESGPGIGRDRAIEHSSGHELRSSHRGETTPYSRRLADQELRQCLAAAGAVLIEGPRASGKTETARQMAQSEVFLDVDRRGSIASCSRWLATSQRSHHWLPWRVMCPDQTSVR